MHLGGMRYSLSDSMTKQWAAFYHYNRLESVPFIHFKAKIEKEKQGCESIISNISYKSINRIEQLP